MSPRPPETTPGARSGSDPVPDSPARSPQPRAKRRVAGQPRPTGTAVPARSARPVAGTRAGAARRGAPAVPAGAVRSAPAGQPDSPAHEDPAPDSAAEQVAGPADQVATGQRAAERDVTDQPDAAAPGPEVTTDRAGYPATATGSGPAGSVPDDATEADAPAGGSAPGPSEQARGRILMVLGSVAVVLVAVAVLVGAGLSAARASAPQANQAFVDSAATAELVGQATTAVVTVYSYDYQDLPANEAAAQGVITGPFAQQFARVFAPVKQLAPKEQAVLRSTVPAAAVISLRGDAARLLMMVDQSGTRGADHQPTGATARLLVDMVRVDGHWKISGVSPE